MQQPICNPFFGGADSVQKILHLKSGASDEMFNDSSMLPSDPDDNARSSSDEYNINFSKQPSQHFGLDYWIKHTNPRSQSPLRCRKSDKSVFNTKSSGGMKPNDACLSSSMSKKLPKGSRKSESIPDTAKSRNASCSQSIKPTKIKYKDYDIPRLKIPKHVIRNYLSTLPSNESSSQSSSSESETSFYSSHKVEKSTKNPKSKSRHRRQNSEFRKSSSSSVIKQDSSCLEKSFENSNYSNPESQSQLSVIGRDIMHLTLKIDQNLCSSFNSTLSRQSSGSDQSSSRRDNYITSADDGNGSDHKDSEQSSLTTDSNCSRTKKTLFYPESNGKSLSYCCDNPFEEKKSIPECSRDGNQQRLFHNDSVCKQVNKTPIVNIRKRSLNSTSDSDDSEVIPVKRKPTQSCSTTITSLATTNEGVKKEYDDNRAPEMSPIDFLKFLTAMLTKYENIICDKYCLSQPNAMKFLAQNHATNWESHKNILHQMHLVPCEFLNEIFHRALHCFGLEKKILKETMDGNQWLSADKCDPSHSQEYKKIRDEYSFALKRVRYGIGVIDELFRRKVNYHNMTQNNDVTVVRKWKHIIYYLCLHAKSAFMAKEIQYHNYVQSSTNPFEGAIDLWSGNTPSVRCLTNVTHEMYNKPQLPKESSKLFDGKFIHKASPDHFSHSDLDTSPHSYDSGKGSSIRTSSSNANSLVSGCHTTSSLNSTPHSLPQDSQLNLSGFQWFRIDEYQATAYEYIRLLPDASQLHNKILNKVGTEPNANSRDNMVKFIHYMEVAQGMSRDDFLNECLQRLVGHVAQV